MGSNCEVCLVEKYEKFKGDSGLTGIRCINKCWSSYRIDALPVYFPSREEQEEMRQNEEHRRLKSRQFGRHK